MCGSDILCDIFLGFIAIFFPPIAVWVRCGICSVDSFINILLCMLGWLPGLFHAWYIIVKFPDRCCGYEQFPGDDAERARVTYVYVQGGPAGPSAAAGHQQGQGIVKQSVNTQQQPAGYGTTAPMVPPGHQEQSGAWSGGEGGEGSSSEPAPPPYEQAVVGDNKVQTRD